jgi:putative ubiquitin-RnfH superfamily antitoxin RatB of RatAB toxin-antitoxin module
MANAETGEAGSIGVEVVYATPQLQTLIPLRVPVGTTLGQAIVLSGMRHYHPEIDLDHQAVGVFGEIATLDRVVREGERIEIYRALRADPKQARRRRAASKKNRAG